MPISTPPPRHEEEEEEWRSRLKMEKSLHPSSELLIDGQSQVSEKAIT